MEVATTPERHDQSGDVDPRELLANQLVATLVAAGVEAEEAARLASETAAKAFDSDDGGGSDRAEAGRPNRDAASGSESDDDQASPPPSDDRRRGNRRMRPQSAQLARQARETVSPAPARRTTGPLQTRRPRSAGQRRRAAPQRTRRAQTGEQSAGRAYYKDRPHEWTVPLAPGLGIKVTVEGGIVRRRAVATLGLADSFASQRRESQRPRSPELEASIRTGKPATRTSTRRLAASDTRRRRSRGDGASWSANVAQKLAGTDRRTRRKQGAVMPSQIAAEARVYGPSIPTKGRGRQGSSRKGTGTRRSGAASSTVTPNRQPTTDNGSATATKSPSRRLAMTAAARRIKQRAKGGHTEGIGGTGTDPYIPVSRKTKVHPYLSARAAEQELQRRAAKLIRNGLASRGKDMFPDYRVDRALEEYLASVQGADTRDDEESGSDDDVPMSTPLMVPHHQLQAFEKAAPGSKSAAYRPRRLRTKHGYVVVDRARELKTVLAEDPTLLLDDNHLDVGLAHLRLRSTGPLLRNMPTAAKRAVRASAKSKARGALNKMAVALAFRRSGKKYASEKRKQIRKDRRQLGLRVGAEHYGSDSSEDKAEDSEQVQAAVALFGIGGAKPKKESEKPSTPKGLQKPVLVGGSTLPALCHVVRCVSHVVCRYSVLPKRRDEGA